MNQVNPLHVAKKQWKILIILLILTLFQHLILYY